MNDNSVTTNVEGDLYVVQSLMAFKMLCNDISLAAGTCS